MNLLLAAILLAVAFFAALLSCVWRTLPDDVPIMDDPPDHPEEFIRWSQE